MPRLDRPALVRALVLACVCTQPGCGDGGSSTVPVEPATFTVVPGVQHVTVTNASPGATLVLRDRNGRRVVGLIADEHGQAVFTYYPDDFAILETGPGATIPINRGSTVKAGRGYTIREEGVDPVRQSEPFAILARDDVPPDPFYASQELHEGFQYLETRDGTRLGAMVRFPETLLWGRGPWPTVVVYSGYSPSNPESAEPDTLLALMMGYAVAGVNMRGTGCSGGVFDLFHPAQHADGYDVIEVVARQTWVLGGRVGMVGLSYPGISQLYVASTRPPHLAAITPLSVIEDPWRQQWPGGVYNAGFTRQWLAERDRSAAPGGSSWVRRRIEQEGDEICEAHQQIRTQNLDFEAFGKALEFYPPAADERRLGLLVGDIEVPVYLTGAWQDEQTGSGFANMLDDFDSTRVKKFILFNGRHPDGYSPSVATRWWEFLEFYVARRIPKQPVLLKLAAPYAFEEYFGVAGLRLEPDRFRGYGDYEEALDDYESEPPVRVLFEVGAAHEVAGAPVARYEASFEGWPPSDAIPRVWYLGGPNELLDGPPDSGGVHAYRHDPDAGAETYTDTSAWDFILPQIDFDWPPLDPGFGLSYLTPPLSSDLVVAGSAYVTLWFASDAEDANIEATITEVQPDGTEVLVQSGLLRAAHRGIDRKRSDRFLVEHTFRAEDFEPLTPGEFREIEVPVRPFAHAFRAGTRLRLVIDTPGRDSPLWAYENPDYGDRAVLHHVAYGKVRPSRLTLPIVEGIDVPPGFPPCPSLRGQICRPFVPLANE